VLSELAQQARYPILLVNDSDILVEKDYLRPRGGPARRSANGCGDMPLSCARAATWPGRWEAIGIATEVRRPA